MLQSHNILHILVQPSHRQMFEINEKHVHISSCERHASIRNMRSKSVKQGYIFWPVEKGFRT